MTSEEVVELLAKRKKVLLKFVRLDDGSFRFGDLNSTFHGQLVPPEHHAESAGELTLYPEKGLQVSGRSNGLNLAWHEDDVKQLEQMFGLRHLDA